MLKRADHTPRFRVKVEHGRIQVVVTQYDLKVADKGTPLERVRGKTVAQTMRCQSLQVAFFRSRFHRSLNVVLVTTPAHPLLRARVAAWSVGRKEPCPMVRKRCPGILVAQ